MMDSVDPQEHDLLVKMFHALPTMEEFNGTEFDSDNIPFDIISEFITESDSEIPELRRARILMSAIYLRVTHVTDDMLGEMHPISNGGGYLSMMAGALMMNAVFLSWGDKDPEHIPDFCRLE